MYYNGKPCIIRFTSGELKNRNYLIKTDDWNNVRPILRWLCRGDHEFEFMTVDITDEIERKLYPIIPVASPLDIDRQMLKVINKIRDIAEKQFTGSELEVFEKCADQIMELHGRFYKTYVDGKPQFDRGGFPTKEDEETKDSEDE